MADYYCDHGAYASVLGTTPTWGVPQDGDGSATAASAAAGTATVDLTSITSVAGTVSIFGSSAISFAASSGATLAANIANAINASTLTVSTSYATGGPQVRNLVYADTVGATLRIMCRVGSATLNILGVVWGGTWSGSAPANLTFAGGVGGCWGWWLNGSAIGVSGSYAVGAYGCMLHKPMVCYRALPHPASDDVHVRARDQSISIIGTASSYVSITRDLGWTPCLVVDDGTVWSGDTGFLTLYLDTTLHDGGYFTRVAFTHQSDSGRLTIRCRKRLGFKIIRLDTSGRSNNPCRLFFSWAPTNTAMGGSVAFYGVDFEDRGRNAANSLDFYGENSTQLQALSARCIFRVLFEDCRYRRTYNAVLPATIPPLINFFPAVSWTWRGCEVDYAISGAGNPGPIIAFPSQPSGFIYDAEVHLIGNTFTGYSAGYPLYSGQVSYPDSGVAQRIIVRENNGLALPSALAGFYTPNYVYPDGVHELLYTSLTGDFRYETSRTNAQFLASALQPTLAGTYTDGATPRSMKVQWFLNAASYDSPLPVPPISVHNRLATATRTITLQLLAPSGMTFTDRMLRLSVRYVAADGSVKYATTAAVVSSAASWASAGGRTAWKMSITTDSQVKVDTEVTAELVFVGNSSSGASVDDIFIDTELVIE